MMTALVVVGSLAVYALAGFAGWWVAGWPRRGDTP